MSSSHLDRVRSYLPWTTTPLIVNAPMGGFALSDLAIAVTKAGGLGQIGGTNDFKALNNELNKVRNSFPDQSDILPIGVGLLCFLGGLDKAVQTLVKNPPIVVWLFAAKSLDDYVVWAEKIRSVLKKSKIWIQVGSVEAAVYIAKTAKPDVLIVQGSDAGGHGYEKGAGLITLLPEVIDNLRTNEFDIPVIGSGGVIDGKGVSAALSLGAIGVVMGTRFLSAKETNVHPLYQQKVLSTVDGGQHTVRTKLFDNLRGPNMWPVLYDGRGVISPSFADHTEGVHIDKIRELHAVSVQADHGGFGDDGRAVIWAGTGVGLVEKVQAAGEIVQQVQNEARKCVRDASAKL